LVDLLRPSLDGALGDAEFSGDLRVGLAGAQAVDAFGAARMWLSASRWWWVAGSFAVPLRPLRDGGRASAEFSGDLRVGLAGAQAVDAFGAARMWRSASAWWWVAGEFAELLRPPPDGALRDVEVVGDPLVRVRGVATEEPRDGLGVADARPPAQDRCDLVDPGLHSLGGPRVARPGDLQFPLEHAEASLQLAGGDLPQLHPCRRRPVVTAAERGLAGRSLGWRASV